MDWDRFGGSWAQVGRKAKARWGRLTDDDLQMVASRDQLAGKIQERYGIATDDIERQIAQWERTVSGIWFAHQDQEVLADPRNALDSVLDWSDKAMLWTAGAVLLVLWALGMVSSHTYGGFIHVLVVVALFLFLVEALQRRRA